MMSMNCVGVFIPRLVECLQAVLQAPREFLGGKKSETRVVLFQTLVNVSAQPWIFHMRINASRDVHGSTRGGT